MEELMEGSVAAPIIFLIVVAVQYLSRYVQHNTSVFFSFFVNFRMISYLDACVWFC